MTTSATHPLEPYQVLNGTYVVLTALAVMIGGQILTPTLTTWTTVLGGGIWLISLPFTKPPEVSRRE